MWKQVLWRQVVAQESKDWIGMVGESNKKLFSSFSKQFINRFLTKGLSEWTNTFPSLEREDFADGIIYSSVAIAHITGRKTLNVTCICQDRYTVCCQQVHEHICFWFHEHIENRIWSAIKSANIVSQNIQSRDHSRLKHQGSELRTHTQCCCRRGV